jgi:hypothetical protein
LLTRDGDSADRQATLDVRPGQAAAVGGNAAQTLVADAFDVHAVQAVPVFVLTGVAGDCKAARPGCTIGNQGEASAFRLPGDRGPVGGIEARQSVFALARFDDQPPPIGVEVQAENTVIQAANHRKFVMRDDDRFVAHSFAFGMRFDGDKPRRRGDNQPRRAHFKPHALVDFVGCPRTNRRPHRV